MRKTSVRRFIHAVIDVLPLLVIPIFALNILHKETEPISITTGGYEYQNRFETNEVTSLNDLTYGNIYHGELNDFTQAQTLATSDIFNLNITTENNYVSVISCENITSLVINANYVITYNVSVQCMVISRSSIGTFTKVEYDFVANSNSPLSAVNHTTFSSSDFNIIDYVYNPEIVLNNTDIGSQFIYALYKPVHDYFNFNNLFNMGAIYDWIQLNLFSGTAPLPIFIIWNVIVYEFFIDLIFLMYSFFMFIIDWSTNMIDKFLYKSRS